MLRSFKTWFQGRKEAGALIDADATALIEYFGEEAFIEALLRQLAAYREVTENRNTHHRERVKMETKSRQPRPKRVRKERPDQ